MRLSYPLLLGLLGLSLTACVQQPKPLYSWGHYQQLTYDYLSAPESDVELQLGQLDLDEQKAKSRNLVLPPGFHAHRGLLHVRLGQMDQAAAAFQAEKLQYPESETYMNFLLSHKTGARP